MVEVAPEVSGYVAECTHQGRLIRDLPQDWRAKLDRSSNLKARVVQAEEGVLLLMLLLLLLLMLLLLLLLLSLLLSLLLLLLLLLLLARLQLVGWKPMMPARDRHAIL